MDINYISDLIVKDITSSITAEEKAELEEWVNSDKENERIYRMLSNSENLDGEYADWNLVDTQRPMMNMKRRISEGKHKSKVIYSVLALVIMVAFSLLFWKYNQSRKQYDALLAAYQTEHYMQSIHPGKTQAQLTTDNGKIIVLGNDSETNEKVLASLKADSADRLALNKLEIPRGGEFHITLEDGTEVWLNAESSLNYPEHFGRNSREVEVKGEAYFKVKKDASRPFSVKIDGERIIVHGTEFNVMSYSEDQYVYTTLVQGQISLQKESSASSELILTPGHQAVFAKADNSIAVQQVNTDAVTSWRNGMFVFENQTLDQIMRQLARWYDFSYEFAGKNLAGMEFMGKVPRYGTFGEVLEILEKSGNLHFEAENKKIIISQNK